MNTSSKRTLRSPWIYFGVTYLWTWSLCGVLMLTGAGASPTLSLILLVLAMIGPGVTGIVFTLLTRSKAEVSDYWHRIIDTKRVTGTWLAIAIALPFILQGMAGAIDGLAGGTGLLWGEGAAAFIANPLAQLLTLCVVSLVPFFEELGWRGYAQDLLEERRSALSVSLILGIVWSLWHLPASFIPGTYQAGLGIGTLEFWLHFGGIIVLSVVISWIYINTERSILIMAVFHAMVNLSGELIELSKVGEAIYTFCWVSAAIAVALGYGRRMRVDPEPSRDVPLRQIAMLLLAAGGLISAAALAPATVHAGDLKTHFESELDDLHRQYVVPGATAAYILPDGTVETVAVGLADVEQHTPMSPESTMLAASVGKTFVSATVLGLASEGRLHLDAPIATWLGDRPWFERVPNHSTITLRHLLNHTSGIANHVETEAFASALAGSWRDEQPMSPEVLVAFALDQPALFPPGQGWSYSDTGYLLAGLIIEQVTGRTYDAEVSRRFLIPLGLTQTRPANRRELPHLATGYVGEGNAFSLPPQTTSHPAVMAWHPGVEWTGGGLISHPRDLVRWGRALFTGQVLAGEGTNTLLQSIPVTDSASYPRYGLGVAIRDAGPLGLSYGHGGWIPGYCTSLRYYPRHDVAVAFQVNTDVGMMDGETPAVEQITRRLAEVVINYETKSG